MKPIEFLKDLINIPSLSGAEEKVADRLSAEFRTLKYDKVICSGGNVCGVRGDGPVKILYDAHMDVVDSGSGWRGDPFKARRVGDRIIGRGACDDKGALAAMVYGGAKAEVSGATLYVLGSVKEEVSEGNGLREFLAREDLKPNFAVIGEPSKLKVSIGNRGRLVIRIDFQGLSGHASDPEAGLNAIHRAAESVSRIIKLNKEISERGDSVAVTRISTPERNLNIIPEKCSIWLDYRSAPGRTKEDILSTFNFISDDDVLEVVTPYYFPWEISPTHGLVKAAGECAVESGCLEETVFWNFCTNASFTAGELGIPTIGFGPGQEEDCHIAEESIDTGQVLHAVNFYCNLPRHIVKHASQN